jgi:hypothetical protein
MVAHRSVPRQTQVPPARDPPPRLGALKAAIQEPTASKRNDVMQSRTVQLEDIFESVSRRLLDEHPGDEQGRMLHSAGLKTVSKFFAFTTKGELVVKLPAARIDELIASGAGRPCHVGKGGPMTEWVRLTPADEGACAAYVVGARNFVAPQANRSYCIDTGAPSCLLVGLTTCL